MKEEKGAIAIKALWRAAKVEKAQAPYDTIHIKILYPAKVDRTRTKTNLNPDPIEPQNAPFPVVILLNGWNCDSLCYQWLAFKLVERGSIVVLFDWISEALPGTIALTPGIDLDNLKPDRYGKSPNGSALPSILAELDKLQSEGVLAGMLDLNKIVLGGHSAGGRISLENANPRFFPQIVASFAYGSTSDGIVRLGYEPGTILPLPSSLPTLLMGGSQDGVVASISEGYGIIPGNPTIPIIRTFEEGISGGRDDTYLVMLEGANHFSITDPSDITTQTGLDLPATRSQAEIRSLLSEIICLFIDTHVHKQTEAKDRLKQLVADNPVIATFECK